MSLMKPFGVSRMRAWLGYVKWIAYSDSNG